MDNFDLKKYLTEGKLNENLQIDDLFGEYVAQWSQGNYDYDFAELFVRSFEKYYEHSITPKQSA